MKGSKYGVKLGGNKSDRTRVRTVLGVECLTTPATPAACLVFTPEEMRLRLRRIHRRVKAEAPWLFKDHPRKIGKLVGVAVAEGEDDHEDSEDYDERS